MYIRWMGAFRKNGSLSEAIIFETKRHTDVACERLQNGKSFIYRARVGLLVDPKAVYKRFSGDVYSKYTFSDGVLYPTRTGKHSGGFHKEAFAKPVYTGIVIKGGSFEDLQSTARKELLLAVRETMLPVYKLKHGKLVSIDISKCIP